MNEVATTLTRAAVRKVLQELLALDGKWCVAVLRENPWTGVKGFEHDPPSSFNEEEISIRLLLCGAHPAILTDRNSSERSWPHMAKRHISDEMWSTTFHHAEPRLVDLAGVCIGDSRTCAEINLRGFCRFELKPHRNIRRELRLQLLK